jgi:hypothetical protein
MRISERQVVIYRQGLLFIHGFTWDSGESAWLGVVL